jgi:hypothetical protein
MKWPQPLSPQQVSGVGRSVVQRVGVSPAMPTATTTTVDDDTAVKHHGLLQKQARATASRSESQPQRPAARRRSSSRACRPTTEPTHFLAQLVLLHNLRVDRHGLVGVSEKEYIHEMNTPKQHEFIESLRHARRARHARTRVCRCFATTSTTSTTISTSTIISTITTSTSTGLTRATTHCGLRVTCDSATIAIVARYRAAYPPLCVSQLPGGAQDGSIDETNLFRDAAHTQTQYTDTQTHRRRVQ